MALYQNPLETRYASREMLTLFSDENRFHIWRDVWIALAESEMELGLNVTPEQVQDLKDHRDDLNLDRAREIEKEIHHDVMSHIRTFGESATKAKGIIHLGATSEFINGNTDAVIFREAMLLVRRRLVMLIQTLRDQAMKYRDLPVLGYTHLQPAQPTTLGKRMSLWLYDLITDLEDLNYRFQNLKPRGVKGTTGTQASFMKLFEGNQTKVKELDLRVAKKLGFEATVPVTGQTLPRKMDFQILSVLSSIAQSAHRAANDVRILQHSWQIEEPFSKNQVGSSAMPYKRNPILGERMSSLSRYLINNLNNAAMTSSFQFLERTLDDSANRRLLIPESFLLADSILIIYQRLIEGLNVYPEVINTHLANNLPFFATENILMEAVKHGGNRQELHEVIREFAMKQVKAIRCGDLYDMLSAMKESGKFDIPESDWDKIGDFKNYVGRAPQQVEELVKNFVDPLLKLHKEEIGIQSEIRV